MFTYGINACAFSHVSIKDFLHENIKIEINKKFRTKHEYLYLYSPETKTTEETCHTKIKRGKMPYVQRFSSAN